MSRSGRRGDDRRFAFTPQARRMNARVAGNAGCGAFPRVPACRGTKGQWQGHGRFASLSLDGRGAATAIFRSPEGTAMTTWKRTLHLMMIAVFMALLAGPVFAEGETTIKGLITRIDGNAITIRDANNA